jgi:DNA-binding transcriptional LysR family regulator
VQNLFDEHKILLKVRLDLGSNEAIKQAIAGGLGISILSAHTLALEGSSSQLTILDVEKFPIERYWYAVYPSGKQLSIVARTFLEYLLTEGKEITEKTAAQNVLSLTNSSFTTTPNVENSGDREHPADHLPVD